MMTLAACSAGTSLGDEGFDPTLTPTRTPRPAVDRPTPTSPPIASDFDAEIELRLVAPSEVSQGKRFEWLDVIMTNTGRSSRSFSYTGNLLNFQVTDGAGRTVWRHLSSVVIPSFGFELGQGESKAISEIPLASQGSWDLRDDEGFPVEPGEYLVKGIVSVDGRDLETTPRTFAVLPAPLADYAQALELELIAPATAVRGEPVAMDMRITNTGDEPLVLWWAGHNIGPRLHYLDIVIFRDGKPIWRAIDAHNITLRGRVRLEAGETRTMGSLFEELFRRLDHEGSREPWMWDQRQQDCGEHRRVMVCEEAAGPGTYTIWGMVNVSMSEPPFRMPPSFTAERATVVTEPQELVITTAAIHTPTPTLTPTPIPTVEGDLLEEPPQGPGAEIGEGYPYTLYVHCGIRDARFDGRRWMADPMLSDGSGNPPTDWTPDDSVGVMELVSEDLARFTGKTGMVIEFRPWPSDMPWTPCV